MVICTACRHIFTPAPPAGAVVTCGECGQQHYVMPPSPPWVPRRRDNRRRWVSKRTGSSSPRAFKAAG